MLPPCAIQLWGSAMSSKPSHRPNHVAPAFGLLAAGLLVAGWPAPRPAAADTGPGYLPPVDAPVVDPFRPPPSPYGPGNRGLEYATAPNIPVRAAAAGTVAFAGPVARTLYVTIDHPDGLSTTYSFLASVAVTAGDLVSQGRVIGASTDRLHFGVRSGEVYLDPAVVLAEPEARVHLVPDDGGTGPPAPPPSDLPTPAGGGGGGSVVSAEALAWAIESGRSTEHWGCTPPTFRPVAPPTRRMAVLVGGLGSTSEHAAIDDIDLGALGYDPADVVRFSYRGGRVPDSVDRAT
ncbi:MAG: peptidoglycan DD-metalloendopeptidase family protein, partial [Acidimicrobiales bacterium]